MIKINLIKKKNPNINLSFKGRRDDHNTVALLKEEKQKDSSFSLPFQKKMKQALINLSKDSSAKNINFLLDIADNLQFGPKKNSPLNSISLDDKYSNTLTSKNEWSLLLEKSATKALQNNKSQEKESLQAKFNSVFSQKSVEITNNIDPRQVSLLSNEEISLKLRNDILNNPLLNIQDKNKKPENYDKHLKTIKKNLDLFIVAPHTSISEKVNSLKELKHFLSDDYKINPQLKDKKPQVLAEILEDIHGHSKILNQKAHGSCAGISVSRKAMAAGHKLSLIQSIKSELDDKETMQVYNLFDYSKKIEVPKADIDYKTALKRTYRILDASVHNWMNIADMIGDGSKDSGYFQPFDAANYDMFHDGHYLNPLTESDDDKQILLSATNKLLKPIKTIEKLKKEQFSAKLMLKEAETLKNHADIFSKNSVNQLLSTINVYDKNLTDLILDPKKIINPDFKIHKNDEDGLKAIKLENLISNKYPDAKIIKGITPLLVNAFNIKAESNTNYETVKKKAHLSADNKMQNEFKSDNYKRALFDMEAFNRVVVEDELAIPSKQIFYATKYDIPNTEELIENKLKQNPNLPPVFTESYKNITKDIDEMFRIFDIDSLENIKIISQDHADILKSSIEQKNPQTTEVLSDVLGERNPNTIINTLDEVSKNIANAKDTKQVFKELRSIGLTSKQNLLTNILLNQKMQLSKTKETTPDDQVTINEYSKLLGLELNKETTIQTIDSFSNQMIQNLENMNKVRDALNIPSEQELIVKALEKDGKISPAKDLDTMFENFNTIYAYGEKKTYTNYNIYLNKKHTADLFDDVSKKLNSEETKNIDVKNLNQNLKNASIQLKGVDIAAIVETFEKINNNIANIKKVTPNKIVSKAIVLIEEELKDKLTEKPELQKIDEKAFIERAEKRLPAVRHKAIRLKQNTFSDIKEELEKNYIKKGETNGAFWVGAQGSSGLNTHQEVRIYSQLTGIDQHQEDNLSIGVDEIKNKNFSPVASVSVSLKEPAGHAMHVKDIGVNKQGEELIVFDNSWGPKELNGLRKDINGNLRTDYTREFGEKGGYYITPELTNGETIKSFNADEWYDKEKNFKGSMFWGVINEGAADVEDTLHDFNISLNKIFTNNYASKLEMYFHKLNASNPEYKNLVKAQYNEAFDADIKDYKDGVIDDKTFNDSLKSENKYLLNNTVNFSTKESKENTINAINEKIDEISKNLKKPLSNESIVNLSNTFNEFVSEKIDKNVIVEKTPNIKKFEKVSELKEQYQKTLDKVIYGSNLELPDKKLFKLNNGIETREEFDNLPKDHLLKLLFNKMAVKGKVSNYTDFLLKNSDSIKTVDRIKALNIKLRKAELKEVLKQKDIKNIEDIKKYETGDVLVKFIDTTFDPKDNAEFMKNFKHLSKMDEMNLDIILGETTEKDLGIKYDDPYTLLVNYKAHHDHVEESFNSVLFNYTLLKAVKTPEDKKTANNLIYRFNKKLENSEKFKASKFKTDFITASNELFFKYPENIYRNLSITYQNNSLEKMFNGNKEEAGRKHGVFPSYPNVKLYSDNEINKHSLNYLTESIQVINSIKTNNNPEEKKQLILQTKVNNIVFVKSYIQPKYQNKALNMLKESFNEIIHAPVQSKYTIPDKTLNFLNEKNISKDIPALLDLVSVEVPKLKYDTQLNTIINTNIANNWNTTLKDASKAATFANIEFAIRGLNKDGIAHQFVNKWKSNMVSNFPNEKKSKIDADFIHDNTVILKQLMDPVNDNHTLRMYANHFGFTDKVFNTMLEPKFLKEQFNEVTKLMKKVIKDPEDVESKGKLGYTIDSFNKNIPLIKTLSEEVDIDEAKGEQLKTFIETVYNDTQKLNQLAKDNIPKE